MTFQLTDAAPSVYVGLADTPYTAPGSVTWTDLTSRVITCETQSDSRDDRTADFSPGQATIVLDNSDRMLDPTWSGSLVYQSADEGLPGSPVKVVANGMTVWYGVLAVSGECWQVDRTRGTAATVTLSAVTLTSFIASVRMPSSPWACGVTNLAPDLWVRGDAASTALAVGDSIPCSIDATQEATPSGTGTLTLGSSLVPDDNNPAMYLGSSNRLKVTSADLATSWAGGGTKSQMCAAVIWQQNSPCTTDTNIMWLYNAGSSHSRWQVSCNSAGIITAEMFSTIGGTVANGSTIIPANPGSSDGRWDDGQPHLVTVQFTGGSKFRVSVDGQVNEPTGTVPASYGEADLLLGTPGGDQAFDEIMFWRLAQSDADMLTLAGYFLGTVAPLARETFAERVDSLAALAGWTGTITDHSTASDPDLWGLGSVLSHPATFGEGLTQATDSFGGALWATRTGTIRARTANALDSGTYASAYRTSVANLTNETSPAGSPTPIRRGVLQRTGARSDRMVTTAQVAFGADNGLGVPSDDLVTTRAEAAAAVIDRYGVKSSEIQTQAIVPDTYAHSLATSMLLTVPPVEVRPVSIDVMDQDTLDFVTDVGAVGLGVEKQVTVTDVDPVSSTTWTADLNVQGETFTWADDGSLTVTVQLAASRVKAARAKTATRSASAGVVVGPSGIAPGTVTAKSLSPTLRASLGVGSTGSTSSGITALTGDVTASGTGSVAASIAAGAVDTTELAADAVTTAKTDPLAGIKNVLGHRYPQEALSRLTDATEGLLQIVHYGDSTVEGATHSGAHDDCYVDHVRTRLESVFGSTNVHDGFQGVWRRNTLSRASDPARWLFSSSSTAWSTAAADAQHGPHPTYLLRGSIKQQTARWSRPGGAGLPDARPVHFTEFDIVYINMPSTSTHGATGVFSYSVNGGFAYYDITPATVSVPTLTRVTITATPAGQAIADQSYIHLKAGNAAGTTDAGNFVPVGISVRQGSTGVEYHNLGQSGASWADHNGLEGSVYGSRPGDFGLWFDEYRPHLVIPSFTNDIATSPNTDPPDPVAVPAAFDALRARVGCRTITNASLTAASSTITTATAQFTSADVGRRITGPGIAPGTVVATYSSTTQITVSNPDVTNPVSYTITDAFIKVGNADIVHIGLMPQLRVASAPADGWVANQAALRAMVLADAETYGHGFIDFWERWGTAAAAQALGYYDTGTAKIHANGFGARVIGDTIARYLLGVLAPTHGLGILSQPVTFVGPVKVTDHGTTSGWVETISDTSGSGRAHTDYYKTGNDTEPIVRVGNITGTGAGLWFGPGGSTAADVTLFRTGSLMLTCTGGLALGSDFSVATSKFTVAASTGNTLAYGNFTAGHAFGGNAHSIYGTLAITGTTTAAAANFSGAVDVAGAFSVATNKFTVAASTGNTVVAGTLTVGGVAVTGGGLTPLYVKSAEVATNSAVTPRTLGTYSVTGSTVSDGDQIHAEFIYATSSGISARTVTTTVTFDGTTVGSFTLSGASAWAVVSLKVVRNGADAKCSLTWAGNAVTGSAIAVTITPANWTSARAVATTGLNSSGTAGDATLKEMTVNRITGVAPA